MSVRPCRGLAGRLLAEATGALLTAGALDTPLSRDRPRGRRVLLDPQTKEHRAMTALAYRPDNRPPPPSPPPP